MLFHSLVSPVSVIALLMFRLRDPSQSPFALHLGVCQGLIEKKLMTVSSTARFSPSNSKSQTGSSFWNKELDRIVCPM